MSPCPTRARSVARLLASVAMVLALAGVSTSSGASSTTVVGATVPSAITLTNNCTSDAATRLGNVQPGSTAISDTGASVCSLGFQSSNDSAMVRVGQADANGSAMTLASGTWTTSVSGSISRLYAAAFVDSSVAMAVGTGGQVRRSMDGGATWPGAATWTNVAGGGTNVMFDVQPVPGTPGTWYAVGGNRSVVKVTNATNATPTFASAAGDLAAKGWGAGEHVRSLAVIDALTVVIAGDAGRVAHTSDGGTTWTVYQVGTTAWYDIARVDATTYWLAGSSGRVAYSTGGFAGTGNWTQLTIPSVFDSFTSIAAGDASHVYTAGNLGSIVACTTAPCSNVANWSVRTTVDLLPEGINGVAANPSAPNTVLLASSSGHVARSTDGAASFQLQRSGTSSTFHAIALDPAGTRAVAVGTDAAISLTANLSTWNLVSSRVVSLTSISLDPTNARTALAVGSEGTIRTSSDGGTTWTSVAPAPDPEGDTFFGVSHGSRLVAWAVGDRGSIVKTEDGGATWSVQSSGVTGRLWSVSAVDEATAFVVGEAGVVLKTTNGGASWSSVAPVASTATLRGVSALPSGRVVVVGHSGYVRYSGNGGTTWAAPGVVPNAKMVDVSMGSDLVGYATSTSFTYKTSNGGANWTLVTSGGYGLDTAGPDVVWSGGSGGIVRSSTDGGVTWSTVSTGSSYQYQDIAGVDGSTAIGVGQEHLVGLTGASGAVNSQVADYGGAPSNWATGTSAVFGMCLQAVSTDTVVNSPTFSAAGSPPCSASDTHPWRGVPQAATKLGHTVTPGHVGRVDIVWGFRPGTNQTPGTYTAAIAFEALAPNV